MALSCTSKCNSCLSNNKSKTNNVRWIENRIKEESKDAECLEVKERVLYCHCAHDMDNGVHMCFADPAATQWWPPCHCPLPALLPAIVCLSSPRPVLCALCLQRNSRAHKQTLLAIKQHTTCQTSCTMCLALCARSLPCLPSPSYQGACMTASPCCVCWACATCLSRRAAARGPRGKCSVWS